MTEPTLSDVQAMRLILEVLQRLPPERHMQVLLAVSMTTAGVSSGELAKIVIDTSKRWADELNRPKD